VALVLAARPAGDPEVVILKGKTSKGLPVLLAFVDGELTRARVKPSLRCGPRHWESVLWTPSTGTQGRFHQDGSAFRVRHVYGAERGRGTLVMTGELADDHDSARGTLVARWVSPGWRCAGTVRFRAG
jgi:hypothetical protein